MSSLADQLAAYLARQMPGTSEVAVSDLSRISGGASRETYRFRLDWRDAAGSAASRLLILRKDPVDSLIDTERRTEFSAYRAFHGSAVPVPEMLYLEEDERHLGSPFFVAEQIAGFEAGPMQLLGPPYADHHAAYAEKKWTILGEIAKADPAALGLTGSMEAPALDACWRRELDHWEAILDADALEPLPIIRAAIRWLRANPPPPAQKLSVVHGDYRTGNFLYDQAGGIHGVLDWEMAHLGDPLEDLGWSFNPIWRWGRPGLVGGLAPRDQAIAIWERASGLKADPAALHWWELFNCVKGQGIWVSSSKAFADGKNRDPILAFSGWLMGNAQDRAALEVMGKL
ncbi:MAG TPA: phosphotransferase family protein [Phenylobacterium sp.]|nr:phosphotransferase family protein [Phenylobacterium sp.]